MDNKFNTTHEDNDIQLQTSPLMSMTMTTDTLSLKTTDLVTTYPDNYYMVNEYRKSIGATTNGHLHEFVPYPPDIISTSVERKTVSDWGYQSKTPFISQQNIKSKRSQTKANVQKLWRMSSQESVVTNDCPQEYNSFDRQSVISLRSFCSGIESNQSNEVFRQTYDSYDVSTETDKVVMISEFSQVAINDDTNGPLFELKRENSKMKGQIEQLDHIMEEMAKERSELMLKLHSLNKEIKLKSEKIDELNTQRETLVVECEELKSGINKWESIVSEYQEVVDAKTLEIKNLSDDIVRLSEDNTNVKISCEHLKIDLESKENIIKQLNKKVIQMNTDIESLVQSKVILEEEIKRKNAEMEAIVTQNEWFKLEMNKLQTRLNETHQKLVSEQQISINARNEWQKAQTFNVLLKQQLTETRHKALEEKDQLMKHLEGINSDLIKNETEKQLFSPNHRKLVNDKSNNELSIEINQKLIDNKLQIDNLMNDLNNLSDINKKLINEQELNVNQLNSMIKQSTDKDYELQTSKSYSNDLELKIRGLNIDLKRQKELNDLLRKDKKESESKLNSLLFDNKGLESATKQLKELIEKHERSLKRLQSNLIAKESKIDLLENEKMKFLETIQVKDQTIQELRVSLNDNKYNENELNIFELKFQNQELEKVMNAMNTELRANQIKFDEQRNHLLKDNEKLKIMLTQEKHRFETLTNTSVEDNNSLKELNEKLKVSDFKINELLTELNLLKSNCNNITGNNSFNDSLEDEQRVQMSDNIIKAKNEKIRCLESNVKLLTKRYREACDSKKQLELKLNNLNQNLLNNKILVSTQTEEEFLGISDINIIQNENELLKQETIRINDEIKLKETIIEENQRIILDLDHQIGKLSSSGENSTNQHIKSLEVLITSKSEEVIRLTETLNEKTKEFKEMEMKLNKKLNDLETSIKKERAVTKDLRHSIFSEKRENNYLKKDLNEMKTSLKESNAVADKRKQEVIDCENEMKVMKEMESSLKSEIERIANDLKLTKDENFKIKKLIENNSHKNGPLLDQLKNLSLSLSEKNQEIDGLKVQLNCLKEKYETEICSLRQQMENYKKQVYSYELNELRKSKSIFQSRLTELSVVIKKSCEQNQKLRQRLDANHISVSQESLVNEEMVNNLLDQNLNETPNNENNSVVNLQSCVDSLKQEMESLQKQISENDI
ncbi:golgin subfamily A member 3-like [Oppia nitens]|uniref:golgin subfamily A member 3-like n=1 Tax=Oppia nitens TaxID=1686743 RepID=UPI0023DBAA0C|nr:golgin subfamily A member 3-like [Oppia nitens]